MGNQSAECGYWEILTDFALVLDLRRLEEGGGLGVLLDMWRWGENGGPGDDAGVVHPLHPTRPANQPFVFLQVVLRGAAIEERFGQSRKAMCIT